MLVSRQMLAQTSRNSGNVNVGVLVFPSMLGEEKLEVAKPRVDAVLATWGKLALTQSSRYKFTLFVVQWFGKADVIEKSAHPKVHLLRVPAQHNASFVTRVLYGFSEIERLLHPDFVVKGDDLTYFLIPNVVRLLSTLDPKEAHMLGHRLQGDTMPRPFLSGGAGYVVSRPLVEFLANVSRSNDSCLRNEGGAEDVTISTCLWVRRNFLLNWSSLDSRSKGMRCEYVARCSRFVVFTCVHVADKFQAFCPLTLLGLAGGVYNFPVEWYEKYRHALGGVACCAREMVSFHYVVPEQMHALHKYRACCLRAMTGVRVAQHTDEANVGRVVGAVSQSRCVRASVKSTLHSLSRHKPNR
jgi:hypothetical protein